MFNDRAEMVSITETLKGLETWADKLFHLARNLQAIIGIYSIITVVRKANHFYYWNVLHVLEAMAMVGRSFIRMSQVHW